MLRNALASAVNSILGLLVGLACAVTLPAADAPPLAGTWKLLVDDNPDRNYILEFKTDGEKVSGVFVSPRSGRYPFEGGRYSGGKLRIEVPRKQEEVTRIFLIEAEWKGERFAGTLHVNGEAAGSVALSREARPASVAGKWKVISKTSDGTEHASEMDLTEVEGKLAGKASSSLGVVELKEVALDGSRLSFLIVLPIQGNDTAFLVNAELKDANTLEGRWKTRDADISGEWSAVREAPPPKAPAPPAGGGVKGFLGEWYGVSTHPDGQRLSFRLALKPHGEGLAGAIISHEGQEHALQEVKVNGTKLEFSIDLGGTPAKVEGELKDGVLGGKWSLPDGQGGEWKSRLPTSL